MKGRWLPVALTTVTLVALNLAARLIVRLTGSGDPTDARDYLISLWSLGAMGLAAAAAGVWWARRWLLGRVVADLALVVVATTLLVVFVGPYVSGNSPFGEGAWFLSLQAAVCLGTLAVCVVLGVSLVTAFGADPKNRAYRSYASRVKLPEGARRPGKAKTKPSRR